MSEDWLTTGNNTDKTVYVMQNGGESTMNLPMDMTLSMAVQRVANNFAFPNVLVRIDGRTVTPSEGTRPISQFNRIEIVPKFAGA